MASTVLDDLKRAYHRAWWALLLRGVLALAVGVFVLIRPLDSVAAFALVIAWWALFSGVVEIVQAIELKSIMQHWWVLLLSGLASVGFGIGSLVYYPVLSLTFAIVMVAWWLMITGLLGLYGAMRQKQLGLQWGWTAAFGVLSIVASGFALLVPPATLAAIMGLIAGFGIVAGVALIAGAVRVRSLIQL
jgi:uncharacterized membrane protein HdeD (DUF308 family)